MYPCNQLSGVGVNNTTPPTYSGAVPVVSRRTLTVKVLSARQYCTGALFLFLYQLTSLTQIQFFVRHTWVVGELREPNLIVQEHKGEVEEPLLG